MSGRHAGFPALRFDVDAQDAERWSDALLDAGALSVDLSDPRADTAAEMPLYGEPDEPVAGLWPLSRINALFAADADVDRMLSDAAAAIGAAAPLCERYAVAEQDWVRVTQRQFEPIEIGAGFWIVPSWCEPPDPAAINLALDPGLAFGTGSHPTTRLCLAWLRETGVVDARVLDYGCGSGILAIAAARLGAREVRGIDVDPQAIRASIDNARNNGVAAHFSLPDALGPGRYDQVVANILANPLIMLAPALSARVREGGRIALSGILEDQQAAVSEAYAHWCTLAPWRRADGWVLLHGERRAAP
jgi:ribosomal protein L11 methyltransferase